ncbi:MAG TPA: hypothetical protein VFV73_26405 [Streptosporangiaceae bacterium]|nr:hypothetical protein [Streptosporangiaceae bacterium]
MPLPTLLRRPCATASFLASYPPRPSKAAPNLVGRIEDAFARGDAAGALGAQLTWPASHTG